MFRIYAPVTSAAIAVLANGTAFAQATDLATLHAQIQALETQIQQLETRIPDKPVAAPPTNARVTMSPSFRPTIESADGQNSISLTGRLHFDVGDYLNYKADSRFTSPASLNSGVN